MGGKKHDVSTKRSKSMKAILVDDETKSMNALNLMLKEYCPQVNVLSLCSSADDALKKITALHPDLLFLDISMPEKNGFELLQELGKTDAEVIFVTAHD